MKTKEQIVKWLKENGYYGRMERQKIAQCSIDFIIDVAIGKKNPSIVISGFAFWELTNEGHEFWRDVDYKFQKWYNN